MRFFTSLPAKDSPCLVATRQAEVKNVVASESAVLDDASFVAVQEVVAVAGVALA